MDWRPNVAYCFIRSGTRPPCQRSEVMMATTRRRDTGRQATDQRTAKTDPYLEIAYQHWSSIAMLYEQFADKKPVMLFDIQEQLLYALPYAAYRAELTERSQAVLKEQYEQAAATGGVVVFVR